MSNALIVVMCNLPWNWPADYMPRTAEILAETNDVICYRGAEPLYPRELLRELTGNGLTAYVRRGRLRLVRPVFLIPGNRSPVIQYVNHAANLILIRLLSAGLHPVRHIQWYFDPLLYPLRRLFPAPGILVYDCVDYVDSSRRLHAGPFSGKEDALIRDCTVMAVNSRSLWSLHRRQRPDIGIVPLGFRGISTSAGAGTVSGRIRKGTSVGFVGTIDDRLDYGLLTELARRHPGWTFSFFGPTSLSAKADRLQWERLLSFTNVRYGRSVDAERIPATIAEFDIGIIPYRADKPQVRYCFPMKVMEYFACGIPVVSSRIDELRRFPKFVRTAATAAEWESAIRGWLRQPPDSDMIDAMRRTAAANSWRRKITALMKLVDSYGE
jgi:glycosyltransferase involved in cell wall biosynthesis